MPTGDSYVNLTLKRFLSQNRMSANILNYLSAMTRDGLSRIFPQSGIFTYPVTITQDGLNGDFDLTPTTVEGIDDAGHVLIATPAMSQNVPYENTVGDEYWLALHYIEIPEGVIINPRTGVPEYDKWKESIGYRDKPDTVTDDGDGTFTVNVDGIFPDGADHTGATVMVWLVNPISGVLATAIETLTVYYAGGHNLIASVGDLGQGTISTNTSDYLVAHVGISVYNAGVAPAGNPYGSSYVVIGNIIGGNPGSNDNGAQYDLSGGGGHTLQHAYDGSSGSGSGRIVTIGAGSQAIEIIKGSSAARSHDINDASLRIRNDTSTALPPLGYSVDKGIDVTTRFLSSTSFLNRVSIADFTGGNKLQVEEVVNVSGSTVTFTRGGALDLTLSGNVGQIHEGRDVIEISLSALGNDGVYIIFDIPTPSTITLREIDGTVPALAVEAGVRARIYRNLFGVRSNALAAAIRINCIQDFFEDYAGAPSLGGPVFDINVAANIDDGEIIYRQYRSAGSRIYLYANGDSYFSGDLTCASMVSAPYLEATTLLTGASAEITTGNLTVDSGDIEATLGNIYTSTGDIISANDIIVTGDYTYDSPKVLHKIIPPQAFHPIDLNAATDLNLTSTISWLNTATANRGLVAEVNLPDGATVTAVDFKINSGDYPTHTISCIMRRTTVNIASASTAPSNTNMATVNAGKNGWDVVTDSSIASAVIDNDTYGYSLFVQLTYNGDELGGARITYSVSGVVMN